MYQVRFEALDTFNGTIEDPIRYVNTSELWVELSELEEFTEYSVIVKGFTVAGAGPFSIPQTNVSMEDCEFCIFIANYCGDGWSKSINVCTIYSVCY